MWKQSTFKKEKTKGGDWAGFGGRGKGRFDLLRSQLCPLSTCPPLLSQFMVLNNKKYIPKRLPLYQGKP